ncbi:hypothetical protein M422DRAFT_273815 [Sphaerobolus stellatus SS14]|uniref:Phorbol-ester/DAG-type domain-containing protein n=1 Tax=Sphaerobolus stellatus (strain SS14) TaxID=990650 RepID=A0A0C9U837_SPHS4|nr:hypothetical protein M422DRAFT_273815 [Sphaerobolus stellatus SS14]
MITIDSYHTATSSSAVSWAAATEGSSIIKESSAPQALPSPPSPPPPTPATPSQPTKPAEPSTPSPPVYPPVPTRPVPPPPQPSSLITTAPLIHRFTLLKPGVKSPPRTSATNSPSRSVSPSRAMSNVNQNVPAQLSGGWSPFHLFFASGLLVARCDLCGQRLGWKSVLECDDCGMRTHLKCGDNAPLDCGLRQVANKH